MKIVSQLWQEGERQDSGVVVIALPPEGCVIFSYGPFPLCGSVSPSQKWGRLVLCLGEEVGRARLVFEDIFEGRTQFIRFPCLPAERHAPCVSIAGRTQPLHMLQVQKESPSCWADILKRIKRVALGNSFHRTSPELCESPRGSRLHLDLSPHS